MGLERGMYGLRERDVWAKRGRCSVSQQITCVCISWAKETVHLLTTNENKHYLNNVQLHVRLVIHSLYKA